MKRKLLILLFIAANSSVCFSQSILNSDLEGIISGYGTLPPSWAAVPFNDINCVATAGGTTPDLVNTTQPGAAIGIIGIPFSGNTFVGGAHGISHTSGTWFQEGIEQTVTDFNIGEAYRISFNQAVVKCSYNIDTSGSWMIILNDSIIGITFPSISQLAYNDTNLIWEAREVNFVSWLNSYVLKLLPFDDDTTHLSSSTDLAGSLYMGIDSLNITPVLVTAAADARNPNDFKIYPNPCAGLFYIDDLSSPADAVSICDSRGRIVAASGRSVKNTYDLSFLENGIYTVAVFYKSSAIYKRLAIIK